MQAFVAKVKVGAEEKTVVVEAASKEDAHRQAGRRGIVVSVKKQASASKGFGFRLTPAERQTLLIRLSSMLGSRVGTAEALRLISETFGGRVKAVAAQLLKQVENGLDLPSAMAADRKNFPAATVAMIKAGIQSGETWRALRDAAVFENEMNNLNGGGGKGMWQAMVQLVMAGSLMIGCSEYIGPMMTENPMFKNAKVESLTLVQAVADFCTFVIVAMLAGFAALFVLATVGRKIAPVKADLLVLRIPFYRDMVLSKGNYIVFHKLALLVKTVRLEEAMTLVADGVPKGALRVDLDNALKAVRAGKPWASMMRTLHPTDKAALLCANSRDEISRTLSILAMQYKDDYVLKMSTFTPAVQAIAATFMTIAGGILFFQTVVPMLEMSSGMMK